MGRIGLTSFRSAAVITMTPSGAAIFAMRPAACWLRTKRTRCAAGRSAVTRPRAARNRAHEVAPIARVGLYVLERLDGVRCGFGGGAQRRGFRRPAGERSLGLRDAPCEGFRPAHADARIDDHAVLQAQRRKRHCEGVVAGAAAELAE